MSTSSDVGNIGRKCYEMDISDFDVLGCLFTNFSLALQVSCSSEITLHDRSGGQAGVQRKR